MWNQVLDNALRETAGRWETEGVGFMLARDYRKTQKRRRGSSGDAVKKRVGCSIIYAGPMICARWQVQ